MSARTTLHHMTRTRQTKAPTSSKSSPCSPVFAPSEAKMQETLNINSRWERLFIRKSALSAIFCLGFGAGKYYHR